MSFNTDIKKGDTVVVIAGKEKSKTGKVIYVNTEKNRASLAGINLVKKHERPNRNNEKGGIIEKEASVHLSNLMYYCTKCNKGVRINLDKAKDGAKVRKCNKCGVELGKVK